MDEPSLYAIGALAKLSGTPVATIRYYEQSGLMPEPPRTSGRQRRYGPSHLERLQFIRHARALGFSSFCASTVRDWSESGQLRPAPSPISWRHSLPASRAS